MPIDLHDTAAREAGQLGSVLIEGIDDVEWVVDEQFGIDARQRKQLAEFWQSFTKNVDSARFQYEHVVAKPREIGGAARFTSVLDSRTLT